MLVLSLLCLHNYLFTSVIGLEGRSGKNKIEKGYVNWLILKIADPCWK